MKCFNCGKEIKDNLKFCTFCGTDLINRVKYVTEIINNDEEEGKDVANNKTAVIAILLSVLVGIFVIVMGISAISRYNNATPIIQPIEEDEHYDFSTNTSYQLLGEEYTFDSDLNDYLANGFVVYNDATLNDTIKANQRRLVVLDKDGVIIQANIHNKTSYPQLQKNCYVYGVHYSKDYNKYTKTKEVVDDDDFILPENVKLYDDYDSIIDKYGDYDKEGYDNNSYVYYYSEEDGYIQLVFNDENKLVGFDIHNEGL